MTIYSHHKDGDRTLYPMLLILQTATGTTTAKCLKMPMVSSPRFLMNVVIHKLHVLIRRYRREKVSGVPQPNAAGLM